jgi:hypothetical protein
MSDKSNPCNGCPGIFLLFRSVCKLLFNVVKHAGVRLAHVDVSELDGCLEVAIADDGAGFEISRDIQFVLLNYFDDGCPRIGVHAFFQRRRLSEPSTGCLGISPVL